MQGVEQTSEGAKAPLVPEQLQYSHYISLWRTHGASQNSCRYEVA